MSVLGKLEKTRESRSPSLRDIGGQHRVCLSISTGPRKLEMLLVFRKRSEEGVCVGARAHVCKCVVPFFFLWVFCPVIRGKRISGTAEGISFPHLTTF